MVFYNEYNTLLENFIIRNKIKNKMYRKRIYGSSQENACPFCGKEANLKSKQGIPVCKDHQTDNLEIKCVCGEILDVMDGKFGTYFNCFKCGNISLRKGLKRSD